MVFGFLALWLGLTDAVDPPYLNVAFTSAWVVSCLGVVAIMEYGRRRPQGVEMTWGEAMLGLGLHFSFCFGCMVSCPICFWFLPTVKSIGGLIGD